MSAEDIARLLNLGGRDSHALTEVITDYFVDDGDLDDSWVEQAGNYTLIGMLWLLQNTQ